MSDFMRGITHVQFWMTRSDLRLAAAPGNVSLTIRESKLKRKSVINVSQILTVDKSVLSDRVVSLPEDLRQRIDEGLRSVLALK